MLTVEEAQARILRDVPRLSSETVPLSAAHGRVLAADVVSPRDVPPWDNSAMDGYALRAADSVDGDVELVLNEVIGAGQVGSIEVAPGTASAIMTGAPVPPGADSVVMVERTDGSREGRVRISGIVGVGDHIRPRGGDVAVGDVVVRAGEVLTPGRVGMVASLGFPSVSVVRKPIVAILSTGDEVIPPGQPLGPGQIYSSNNYSLAGQVLEAGGVPRDHGNAPDDLDGLVACLREAIDGADVVLTTGGVSVGAYDYVKEAYGELGVAMDFWKVRMKPGKPLAFARLGDVPLFGLPGNPVSCMVNFLQYVRPWMRIAQGLPRPYLPVIEAVAAESIREKPGRAKLVRVVLDDEGHVRSTGSQSSGVLTSMARAHGLLLLGADRGGCEAGDTVRVQLLDPSFMDGEEAGFGW